MSNKGPGHLFERGRSYYVTDCGIRTPEDLHDTIHNPYRDMEMRYKLDIGGNGVVAEIRFVPPKWLAA